MFAKFFRGDLNRIYLAQCVCFLALLVIAFSVATPYFATPVNISNVLTASTVIGLMALGATFVIASGAIDLSTAAVMALSGVLSAWCVQKYNINPLEALSVSLSTGIICGFITGWLVNVTRAPSFIITLGMLSIVRAIAYIASGGSPITGLDESVSNLAQLNIFGLPLPAATLLFCTALAYLLLAKTQFGTHTLILGDNAGAAEAMGLYVNRLRLKIFTIAGIFSGLAGFVFMARTNSGDPSAGQSYELIAITAVVLGGANLFGGRAAIFGTLLGVLCLGVLQNGLNLMAISTFYQTLFVGLVLVLASFLRRFRPQI
jgi:ribose transport system permease protein